MPENLDRFASPTYSTEEVELEGEGIAEKIKPAVEILKKNIKIIVIVIVLAVVALFAYDFFVGSVREITIVVKDTEGDPLFQNRLKLFDSAGNEIATLTEDSSYTVQLKVGSYKYEISVPNYETKRGTFEVSESGQIQQITVEKDVDVEIEDFKEAFPSAWVEGQSRTVEFHVKNNESVAKDIEIVFEGDLDEWGTSSKSVTVQAKGTQAVAVQITVPKDLGIKDEREGEKFKASARVKYTLEKQSKDFTVFPAPELELDLKSMPRSADAGETNTKGKVEIENKSDFPLEELQLQIEITSAPKNRASKVIGWFKFQEKAGEPDAWKIDIASIAADSDIEKAIRVDVPLTAKKETITGKVVLTASFLPEPLVKEFNLVIKEEADFGIELTARESIDIEWSEEIGNYETVTEILRVKNVGETSLSNIVVSVKNYLVCSTDWLELLQPTTISSLAEGDSREITMSVSAPIAQRGSESTMLCKLKYRFDNPLAGSPGETDFIEDEMENWIRVEPQPD